MPQCAPSIISGFSSANVPLAPCSHSKLLALLGAGGGGGAVVVVVWHGLSQTWRCAFLCVHAYMQFCKVRCEICCVYVWAIWSMQGCEVGSFSSPDVLAGICKRWITRQRESIIQRKEKKKNETETLAPVAPGSLFQFRDWFSQNVEGKRREEKQPWRSEGGMMRSWGRKKRKGMKPPYMCVSSPFLPLSPSWSNPESKAQCENAKCYYQAFRVHKCHLWWMSVGFRKASCPTPAVSPP